MAQISRPRTGHDIHGRDDMTTGFGGNSTGNRGFDQLWFIYGIKTENGWTKS